MAKPIGRFSADTPGAHPINWKVNHGDLDKFVNEVLETLGKPGASIWYPITAYTLRMVQAARFRLWQSGGCAIRVRTDVDTDRLYVRAAWDVAFGLNAWTKEASRRGISVGSPKKLREKLRVLQGGKKRSRAA